MQCDKCGVYDAVQTGKHHKLCHDCAVKWGDYLKEHPLPDENWQSKWIEAYQKFCKEDVRKVNEEVRKEVRENMKYSHYTPEEDRWLLAKADMPKYQSKGGCMRIAKLRTAFEAAFGGTRSRQALGNHLRKVQETAGTYKKRKFNSGRKVKKQSSGLTLGEIGARLTKIEGTLDRLDKFFQ